MTDVYLGETDALFLGAEKNRMFVRLRQMLKALGDKKPVKLVLSGPDYELFSIHCRQYTIDLAGGKAKFNLVPIHHEPGDQTIFVVDTP